MSEEQAAELEQSASHDEAAAPSTAPEVEAKPASEAEASATETPEEPKKPNKVQQRINQLTREKHEQRQENADLRARIERLEQPRDVDTAPELVAPNEDDFDSSVEYHTANAKYYADVSTNAARTEVAASNKSSTEAEQQRDRQTELNGKKGVFEKNLEGKRGHFEDFEDVAYGHNFMDIELAEQLFDMDKGPEVAYHLGSHLDEAERIFALPEGKRGFELGILASKVESLTPKKVSDAPDPITPLGGNETVQKSEDDMSDAQWLQWRYNQINARNAPPGK